MPLRGDSSLECQQARELTRAFLSGGGVLERRAEWRAHLAACRECDAHYRETVEMIARLHRARRDGPGSERAPEPAPRAAATSSEEERAPRRSLIAYSPPARSLWRVRKRSGWLALAIPFVALLVFAAVGLPGGEPRVASVLALQGEVGLNQHYLAPGDAAETLPRGGRVSVGHAARARLQDEHCELVLEGEGEVQCERLSPLRVRLFGGTLHVRGPCTISSALGVVQNGAEALELRLSEDGLQIQAAGAGACFLDVNGRRALAAGEVLHVEAHLAPAASH